MHVQHLVQVICVNYGISLQQSQSRYDVELAATYRGKKQYGISWGCKHAIKYIIRAAYLQSLSI